jgi:hypothetical protein
MIFVIVLSYISFTMLRNAPSICSKFRAFCMKEYWIFSTGFSASVETDIHVIFCSTFYLWVLLHYLFIYMCWTIITSLEWTNLIMVYNLCVVEFNWQVSYRDFFVSVIFLLFVMTIFNFGIKVILAS